MKTGYERSYDVFAAFPEGLTCYEFVDLLDDPADKENASGRLSQFVKEGLAIKDGHRVRETTGQTSIVYVPTGRAFSERIMEWRETTRKRRRPTDSELVQLRKWKAAAIERFPELGTDPAVLAARKKLSEILRKEGNAIKASLVESGDLDDSESMRIVLSCL
ncbi:MAG: hypothetical protein EBT04_06955 [Betaproteobacteria bacterium]|nr:hypothetical protein [Betaproteobacteria bacterium]